MCAEEVALAHVLDRYDDAAQTTFGDDRPDGGQAVVSR